MLCFGAPGRTRTGTGVSPRDFKSIVSTKFHHRSILVYLEGFEPSTSRLSVVLSTADIQVNIYKTYLLSNAPNYTMNSFEFSRTRTGTFRVTVQYDK